MKNVSELLKSRFENKKVILLGAGVSNTPLARFLSSFGAGVEIRDRKNESELKSEVLELKDDGVTFVTGEDYLDGMCADFIFRSPGFRPDLPALCEARKQGCVVTSEMELFMEIRPAFVIGVTGSDGKSTTTTLIYKMLDAAYADSGRGIYLGGNIGFPLLDRVCGMDDDSFVSCELSSFQLMSISSPVDVAVITNVSPNHLNWHTGMDEYIEAKAKILNGASRAVLNFGCDITRELGRNCACPVTYFSRVPIDPSEIEEKDSAIFLDGDDIFMCNFRGERKFVMHRSDILLPGLHNTENYMTAIAALGDLISPEDALRVARTFGGVKHRFELIRIRDGVYYYNSSIDSSPTRTAAALSALTDKPINLICGGYDKNIPFAPLAEAIAHHGNIRSVTLTGATADKIKDAIENCPDFDIEKIRVVTERDFTDAVMCAGSFAEAGDAVLLSPACASFDAFENFEVRGDFFRKLVMELD